MRMRTLTEAFEYIKANDPETAITKTGLRRLVTTGKLPSVRVGTKYLVSLENIEEHLSGKTNETHNLTQSNGIRQINIR